MREFEGFLEKVLFKEGQHVKTGDLLYQIEKTQYQAAVDQANANLAAAEAVQLNAQLQFARADNLVKTQAVPQTTLDQDRANLDSAKASILQNKATLAIAQENLGYTDIKSPIDGRIGLTDLHAGKSRQSRQRRSGDDRQRRSDIRRISGERAPDRGHNDQA